MSCQDHPKIWRNDKSKRAVNRKLHNGAHDEAEVTRRLIDVNVGQAHPSVISMECHRNGAMFSLSLLLQETQIKSIIMIENVSTRYINTF